MLRVLVRTAFCICSATTLLFSPTSCLSAWLTSLEYPLRMSIMILYCVTLYFGNLCFSSQRSGPYFSVFSSVFSSLFCCIHGQLISSTTTVSLSLSTIVASIVIITIIIIKVIIIIIIFSYRKADLAKIREEADLLMNKQQVL